MPIFRRRGLFVVLYLALACNRWAGGFEILDGELETSIGLFCDETIVECISMDGDGTEAVAVVPEITSYSISRIGTVTFSYGGKVQERVAATADLGFDHSPSVISIEGAVSGTTNLVGYAGTASLVGSVNLELEEPELVQIVYPLGSNLNNTVHLTTADGASVFFCRTSDLFDIQDCAEQEDLSVLFPYEDPFLLDGGRYNLSFSAEETVSAGTNTPGLLDFSLVVVPEPSSLLLFIVALVVCFARSRCVSAAA